MTNKSGFPVFLLVSFCVLLVLSCGKNSYYNSDYFSVAQINAKELIEPVYGDQDSASQTAAKGANDFAFRLSAALLENTGSKNFVCSPYSAWLPLAALLNATNAENKSALLAALGAAGIGEADVNKAASRMLYDLNNLRRKDEKDYYNPLKIANAIFVGNNVTLRSSFAQTFMDYYRGSSVNVDFSSQSAVDAVNRWASDNTDGLIRNLVQKFEQDTVAAIANAIYFSDRWEWEFSAAQTKEGVFYGPDGNGTASYMLREGDAQTYYEDNKVQAMPLRFKSGGGLYIILPKSGSAAGFLSSMTSKDFDAIQNNSVQATGKLLLPRFSIEGDTINLKKALEKLGVPLFNEATAPLTGGLIQEGLPVFLSDAMQKALIKVDEKGTTAAAVTLMTAAATGMPVPTTPFEMICNKPFVFILYDYTYDGGNQILFTGVVNQP